MNCDQFNCSKYWFDYPEISFTWNICVMVKIRIHAVWVYIFIYDYCQLLGFVGRNSCKSWNCAFSRAELSRFKIKIFKFKVDNNRIMATRQPEGPREWNIVSWTSTGIYNYKKNPKRKIMHSSMFNYSSPLKQNRFTAFENFHAFFLANLLRGKLFFTLHVCYRMIKIRSEGLVVEAQPPS